MVRLSDIMGQPPDSNRIEKMGIIDAERFVSILIREKSDYTQWRRRYFDGVSSEDFHAAALSYGTDNPL